MYLFSLACATGVSEEAFVPAVAAVTVVPNMVAAIVEPIKSSPGNPMEKISTKSHKAVSQTTKIQPPTQLGELPTQLSGGPDLPLTPVEPTSKILGL